MCKARLRTLSLLLLCSACADAGWNGLPTSADHTPPLSDPAFLANETVRQEAEGLISAVDPAVIKADGMSWVLDPSIELTPDAVTFARQTQEGFDLYSKELHAEIAAAVSVAPVPSSLLIAPLNSRYIRVEVLWWGIRVWYSPQLITLINVALTSPGVGAAGLTTYLAAAGMSLPVANVLAASTVFLWRVIGLVNARNGGKGVYLNWNWRLPGAVIWISSPSTYPR